MAKILRHIEIPIDVAKKKAALAEELRRAESRRKAEARANNHSADLRHWPFAGLEQFVQPKARKRVRT